MIIDLITLGAILMSLVGIAFYTKDLERRIFEQETYLHLVDEVVKTTVKLLDHVIKDHYGDEYESLLDDSPRSKEYLH